MAQLTGFPVMFATALAAADRDRVNEAAFELALRGIVAAIEGTLSR